MTWPFLTEAGLASWGVLLEASPYLLLGLLITGLLHVLLPGRRIRRLLGGRGLWPSLKAMAFAIPLPICSCGIMSLVISLKRKGVPRSALMVLLMATPETGVSALLLTFALLGPVMGWIRPLVALVAALVAAALVHFLASPSEPDEGPAEDDPLPEAQGSLRQRIWGGTRAMVHHAFVEILDDIALWVLVGVLLSGIVSALLPAELLSTRGPLPLLAAVLTSIPLYMCAASSTPLGLALAAKGLGPGPVMAFLILGPVTNAGTLALVHKHFGGSFLRIYLGTMVLITLAVATVLDAAYPAFGADLAPVGQPSSGLPPWLSLSCTLVFLALAGASLRRVGVKAHLRDLAGQVEALTRGVISPRRWHPVRRLRTLARRPLHGSLLVLAVALVGALVSSTAVVEPEQRAFRMRFGRIVDELEPGFHLKWPHERVLPVPAGRMTALSVGFSFPEDEEPVVPLPDEWMSGSLRFHHEGALSVTGDEHLVEVAFAVLFRVRDHRGYIFGIADGPGIVEALAQEEMRNIVRRRAFQELLEARRSDLGDQAKQNLQLALDRIRAGVEVTDVAVVGLYPPAQAAWAFREVSNAKEDHAALVERASGRALWALAQSKGAVAERLSAATRYGDDRRARARGQASAFLSRLEEYGVVPRMTRFRLVMEALERSLPRAEVMVVPASSAREDLDLLWGWSWGADLPPPRPEPVRQEPVRPAPAKDEGE